MGCRRDVKDNTVKTRGSLQRSTRDDTLLGYTCDHKKRLKTHQTTVFLDFCGKSVYIFFTLLANTCFYARGKNVTLYI